MNNKVIALVDWYWGGHHANFFVNFAAAIAKAGYRVVPLCSDPDDFTSRLKSLLSEDGNEDLKDSIHDPLFLGQPRRSKIRPARYRAARNAGLRFGAVSKRLREWERIQGAKISCVFFSCIYEQDFECVKKIDKSFGFQWSGLYLHARSFRKPGSKVPYTGMTSCPEKIFSSALVHSVAVLDESAVEPMARITGGKPIICMPAVVSYTVCSDHFT